MTRLVFALFVAVAVLADPVPAAAQGPKVYAVLVLDTLADNDMRASLAKDREMVRGILSGGIADGRVEFSEVIGNDVTLDGLRAHLRKLPVRAGVDTVFCYVGSHGATDKDNPTRHVFQWHGKGMEFAPRDDVRAALTGTGAKLSILLSDSCSNGISLGPKNPPKVGVLNKAGPTNLPLFDGLFFGTSGVVDINASKVGTYAWFSTTEGGVFTRALNETFIALKDKPNTSWAGFYQALKQRTDATYQDWRKVMTEVDYPPMTRGGLRARDAQALADMTTQKRQITQAYYLDGTRLRVIVEDAFPDNTGALIEEMPVNSPGLLAGLRNGDVIVKINGKPVLSAADYVAVGGEILGKSPDADARMTFTVRRAGRDMDIDVTVPPMKR